jgi:hypothetical protein
VGLGLQIERQFRSDNALSIRHHNPSETNRSTLVLSNANWCTNTQGKVGSERQSGLVRPNRLFATVSRDQARIQSDRHCRIQIDSKDKTN